MTDSAPNRSPNPNQPYPVTQIGNLPYRRLAACSRFRLLLLIGTWTLALGSSETSAFSLGGRALAPLAFLAELPAPTATAFGQWLISAVAALSILALGKQFVRKTPLEAEFLTKREFQEFKDKDFASLRNRIEYSHESLANKLDAINHRLSDVASLVARLDERTKLHSVHPASTPSTESQVLNRKS